MIFYNLFVQYFGLLSGSLTAIHTWAHLAFFNHHEGQLIQWPTRGPNDFETQSSHISLMNLSGHSTTGTLAH